MLPPPKISTALVPVAQIRANPLNPRKHFDPVTVTEYAASLKSQGQLEQIKLRPLAGHTDAFELVDGELRWRAAPEAGILALNATVGDYTDGQCIAYGLATGTHKSVLSAIEEAEGIDNFMRVRGLNQTEAAAELGLDRPTVVRRLALLDLPEEPREWVMLNKLPATTAWLIARVPDRAMREALAKQVLHPSALEGPLSFRATQQLIENNYVRSLKGAPFDPKDAALVPEAGACAACPFCADKNKEIYGDVRKPSACMQPSCFERKVLAARSVAAAKASAAGKTVLAPEENERVMSDGGVMIGWDTGYVEFSKPPPADLLKKEVVHPPKWRDLVGEDVQVYTGFDANNRAVDLVKVEEALSAVPTAERALFNTMVHSRYFLAKSKPSDKATATQRSAEEHGKAGKQRMARRDRESQLWLGQLFPALARPDNISSQALWSLLYERALEALTEADAEFICGAVPEIAAHCNDRNDAIEAIKDYAATTPATLTALVLALQLAPQVRAAGANAKWVVEWHSHFVAAGEPSQDPAQLAEWQKAHDAGMSPQKIADTYKATLEDVCGALGLDVLPAKNVVTQLRMDVEETLELAGIKSAEVRDKLSKFSCCKLYADLAWPEDYQALLRVLSQQRAAKPTVDADDKEAA